MIQPNLFTYATSELSQDAFICWLLTWASPEYKNTDSNLHHCGVELIKAFFEKHEIPLPHSIEKVEVKKQDSRIDVLCIVNNTYAILIEDKTGTKNSPGQLSKYLSEVKKQFGEDKVIPIYFKTYDQASYADVIKNEYKVFSRFDFLAILNKGNEIGVKNEIFQDFRKHLQIIADKVESYLTLPIEKWHRLSWVGFYLRLQKELGTGHWDYVANPSGGFLGFWWHSQGNETCKQYLQLEQSKLPGRSKLYERSKLHFKISVKEISARPALRNKWHKLIKNKSSGSGFTLEKQSRFGNGNHMTVLVACEEYRKVKENGQIDINATINHLRNAEDLLRSVQENP